MTGTLFSRNVAQRMLELQLDNRTAAKRCDVSYGTIHNIVRQTPKWKPQAATVEKITRGLWGKTSPLFNTKDIVAPAASTKKPQTLTTQDEITLILGGLELVIRRNG